MFGAKIKARKHRPGSRISNGQDAQGNVTRAGRRHPCGLVSTINPRSIVVASSVLIFLVLLYLLFFVRGTRRPLSVADVPAFFVADIPGRGKGLIASRDIKQGEMLIREKPLVVVPRSTNMSPVALIAERLSLLSWDERKEFYSLSYVSPSQDPGSKTLLLDGEIDLAIFQTNAISAGENVGLFPRTARLNHGCGSAFNSVYSWRPQEGTLVVHTLKHIKRGDELLTTYLDTKKSRNERRDYLQRFYGFNCSCSVCSLSSSESAASDNRLARMSSLGQVFETWGRGYLGGKDAVSVAKEIWTLGEKENYWSERGRLAGDVVFIAAAHSDEQAVAAWASLAFKWSTIELGRDSTQAQEMHVLVSTPRSHFAWSTREPLVVGMPDM
ncbi:hypothetical protein M0805_005305 [Coniferiporia weirii]|nr:hypothetical protein M0805_005305 [Coniferiporia weirii]